MLNEQEEPGVRMTEKIQQLIESDARVRAFDCVRRGKSIPAGTFLKVALHGLFVEPVLFFVRMFPGAVGVQLRVWLARLTLRRMGKSSFIELGATLSGAENISISDFVLVDRGVELDAQGGEIVIGRRVHIGPGAHIAGLGGVYVGDYAAIGRNAQVLSHSEVAEGGKRVSGPMIPEEFNGMKTASVRLEKDSLVGAGAVILPGVTLGEGAVVAPNSLVISSVKPWQVVMGVPARPVSTRAPVTVPDI